MIYGFLAGEFESYIWKKKKKTVLDREFRVRTPQHEKQLTIYNCKIGAKKGSAVQLINFFIFRIIMPYRKLLLLFTLTELERVAVVATFGSIDLVTVSDAILTGRETRLERKLFV